MSPTQPACPLCHEPVRIAWGEARDPLHADRPPYTLWRCRLCHLIYLDPATVPTDVYPPDYAPHTTVPPRRGLYGYLRERLKRWTLTDHKGYPLACRPISWRQGLTRLLLPLTAQIPPWMPQGRLLDVGCGGGTYLRAMAQLGWQVYGIEPDARAAQQARQAARAHIWTETAEEADLPAHSFHVVTLWHSLEHMARPLEALHALRRSLRQEGLLMLEVPNFDGPGRQLHGPHWFHLDVPRHRLALTPATLERLLLRAGFAEIRIRPVANAAGLVGPASRLRAPAAFLSALLAWSGWGECLRATARPST